MDPTRWHWADRLPFWFRIWAVPLLSISFDGAFQLNDFVLSDWDLPKPRGSCPTLATIAWSLQEKELLASNEFPARNASLDWTCGSKQWLGTSICWSHPLSPLVFYRLTGYRPALLHCNEPCQPCTQASVEPVAWRVVVYPACLTKWPRWPTTGPLVDSGSASE